MSESELLDELLKIDDTLTRAYYLKEDYLSFNNLFDLILERNLNQFLITILTIVYYLVLNSL